MLSKYKIFVLLLALMLTIGAVSCSDDEDAPEGDDLGTEENGDDNPGTKPPFTPPTDPATITGVIKFEGAPPKPKPISMDADGYCLQNNPNATAESLVVNDGKLANVIVYVKEGPVTKNSFPKPAEAATLDQKNCQYTPHVVSFMIQQDFKVLNSDNTNHNVHPLPKTNKEWNESQSPKGDPIVKTFPRQEVIPVKCNIHPWMKAYLGVFDHPFHTVSKADGSFEIKGLPPGDYTIEAWHETLPAQTQKVTVAAKDAKTVEFTFKAEAAYRTPEQNGVKLGAALLLDCCQH
ncbi:MAG: carboxypeptidase regulatory-like domain-containing protein [Acidobacteriota bacterium]